MEEVDSSTISNSTSCTESGKEYDGSQILLLKIAALYNERYLSDLCLVVGGSEYLCHRLILSASSQVLQVMLMNPQWTEATESKIELIEPVECHSVFADFLQYFYTGKICIKLHSVLPILLLADKYMVKDLVTLSLSYMQAHVATASSCRILVSWLQYTADCGHTEVAESCRNFVKWNFTKVAKTEELYQFDTDTMVSLLQCSDLVVDDETVLYHCVVQWLQLQMQKMQNEEEEEELIRLVLSQIRFPMMYPKQLASLLLHPLTMKYKDFFMEKMATGMAFHSQETHLVAEQLIKEGSLAFTPRLYTDDKYSTLLTIDNFSLLPMYHNSTLVFSSMSSLAEVAGDQTTEWVVDVHPKGVWFRKFCLIVWQGTVEVPEYVHRAFRVSITCKEPPELQAGVRVKIGILIYGTQNGVEHIKLVYQRNHYFSRSDPVLNLDDILPFDCLTKSLGCLNLFPRDSEYLVNPDRDTLKMHIIIEPLGDVESILRQS